MNKAKSNQHQRPEDLCDQSVLETKPANEWIDTSVANERHTELFGPFWRKGELAVMFGDSGSGKSTLGVQIAELIAREIESRGKDRWTHPSPVLYLDFENTPAQFAGRYTCPSDDPGETPVVYDFSPNLRRASFGNLALPPEFKGDFGRYVQHSIQTTISNVAPDYIVIDNLESLDMRASTATCVRRLRSIRLAAMSGGTSLLVIAHSRRGQMSTDGHLKPLELKDVPHGQQIAEIADSVFAIGRSSYHEDVRYLKHLRAKGAPADNAAFGKPFSAAKLMNPSSPVANVLTFRLERTDAPQKPLWDANKIPSDLEASPEEAPAKPFLGFTCLGPANEYDLIQYLHPETRDVRTRERSHLTKLAQNSVVRALISREYRHYIEGP